VPVRRVTLEAVGLGKRYGSRSAVEGLSLTAYEGEIVGLLGPNGAGKTTTIRLLTTVLDPSSGTFSVAGVPHTQPLEIRRRVGVLPESLGFPGRLTGVEYLRYHARLFGVPRREVHGLATGLLGEVGLAERGSTRISTYSRGMRQRLGLARALLNDPSVVFLDEPTLGLDPAGQRQVLDLLRRVAARRRATVILSTHTLPEVEQVCARVVILDHGRTVASGTVAEIAGAVAVPRTARVRVPAERAERARDTLDRVGGWAVRGDAEEPGVLVVSVPAPSGPASQPAPGLNEVLRRLVEADVPVLEFNVERMPLSEAFLAMTGQAR